MHRQRRIVEVEVEIDLDQIDDDDLKQELEERGYTVSQHSDLLVEKIYHSRIMGRDYQKDLDELIYQLIGRIS